MTSGPPLGLRPHHIRATNRPQLPLRYRRFSDRLLDDVIAEIGEELHGQYLLTYMPSTQHQAGFHEILVTVQQPALIVRTRDGYWLAAKPE